MRIHALIVPIAAILAGCVSSEPAKSPDIGEPYRKHYEAGLIAEGKGDYRTAQREYAHAYKLAEEKKLGPAMVSAATYELGRVTGYLCDYELAHRLLRQSLSLEEQVSGPYSANTSARYIELGRLNYDHGRFAMAVPYYERGVPLLEKLDVEKSDPLGFADVLEELALSLKNSGAEREGQRVLRQADVLRAKYANRTRAFVPTRYNQNCQSK